MDCCICYETFKEYELISNGCCSCKLCANCIKNIDKCPMCTKSFFWRNRIDNQYMFNIHKLQYEHMQVVINNTHLRSKIEEKEEVNKHLINSIIGKDIKIKKLMDRIDVIDHHLDILIDEKKNKEELEKVIQKYHLNII